jgi:hypothetical protein
VASDIRERNRQTSTKVNETWMGHRRSPEYADVGTESGFARYHQESGAARGLRRNGRAAGRAGYARSRAGAWREQGIQLAADAPEIGARLFFRPDMAAHLSDKARYVNAANKPLPARKDRPIP